MELITLQVLLLLRFGCVLRVGDNSKRKQDKYEEIALAIAGTFHNLPEKGKESLLPTTY